MQVLPSLREKHDEFMLRELVKRWSNHKVMVRWLSRFFHYLDRYFIARRSLPALNEVGLTCFRNLVSYHQLHSNTCSLCWTILLQCGSSYAFCFFSHVPHLRSLLSPCSGSIFCFPALIFHFFTM